VYEDLVAHVDANAAYIPALKELEYGSEEYIDARNNWIQTFL
jgi:hypothetical protein